MKKTTEQKPASKKTAVPVIKATAERRGLEMDINREEFAMALKTWRLRMGLTQEQVGERWGTSRYTIMRAEKAKDVTWMSAYKLFAKLAKELSNENQE